jgi:hypothetical protein
MIMATVKFDARPYYIEYGPGKPAPLAGRYELTNAAGNPTDLQVEMDKGEPFPDAPFGNYWRKMRGVPRYRR